MSKEETISHPFVTMADLRLDLLPRIRQMALTHAGGKHP